MRLSVGASDCAKAGFATSAQSERLSWKILVMVLGLEVRDYDPSITPLIQFL